MSEVVKFSESEPEETRKRLRDLHQDTIQLCKVYGARLNLAEPGVCFVVENCCAELASALTQKFQSETPSIVCVYRSQLKEFIVP